MPISITSSQKAAASAKNGYRRSADELFVALHPDPFHGRIGTTIPHQYSLTLPSEPVVNVSKTVWPLSYDNMRPCISGLNTYDSCMVMIAHESNLRLYVNSDEHGITVEKVRSPGTTWLKSAHFETTWDAPFLQPSIEVTKFHDFKFGFTQTDYYFSLAFMEDQSGFRTTLHFAMDDSTSRLTVVTFPDEMYPQLSVEHDGRDSNVQRVGLSKDDQPRKLLSSHDALFKLAVDRSQLNLYRTVALKDDSSDLSVLTGLGEISTDDGVTLIPVDLIEREDTARFDSSHGLGWFLRSQEFTLSAGADIRYTPWIATSDDSSYFAMHRTPVLVYCDFVDTAGLVSQLDSLWIDDTTRPLAPALRTFPTAYTTEKRGHIELVATTGDLSDTGARVQEIVSLIKLSEAGKKAGRQAFTSDLGVALTIDPNPFKDHVTLGFVIPENGEVGFEVMDALGNIVDRIAPREFRAGEHRVRWQPAEPLASGIYTVLLRYGNSVVTAHAVFLR